MTRVEAYASLIKAAAQLAQGRGMISPYHDDHKWYVTTPRAERRRIIKLAEDADSQCKDLAMRIKGAADALMAASNPKVEQ
jgi:hypothetical protein